MQNHSPLRFAVNAGETRGTPDRHERQTHRHELTKREMQRSCVERQLSVRQGGSRAEAHEAKRGETSTTVKVTPSTLTSSRCPVGVRKVSGG